VAQQSRINRAYISLMQTIHDTIDRPSFTSSDVERDKPPTTSSLLTAPATTSASTIQTEKDASAKKRPILALTEKRSQKSTVLPGAVNISSPEAADEELDDEIDLDNVNDDSAALPTNNAPADDSIPIVAEATLVTASAVINDDRRRSAGRSIYEAVVIPPWRRAAPWVVVVVVVLALVLGTAISLTTRDPDPVSSAPTMAQDPTRSKLAWIAQSSVEEAARSLPSQTVSAIAEDLKQGRASLSLPNSGNTDWFIDDLWVSNNYRPMASAAKAWKWLVSTSTVAEYSTSDVTTRFAMAVFYYHTRGLSWLNNSNWVDTSKHVCDWSMSYSPTAEDLSSCVANGLSKFYLTENRLIGMLPYELGLLTTLTELNVQGNTELRGFIPSSIEALTDLRLLVLSGNELSGAIPASLGRLTKLESLEAESMIMTGPFPLSMSQLTALTSVKATFNEPHFPEAALLRRWTNLQYLYLSTPQDVDKAQTYGTIPTEIGLMTNLKSMALNFFPSSGTLPEEIGRLTDLDFFQLRPTRLQGTLPTELSLLTKLKVFQLEGSDISGTIANSLFETWQGVTYIGLFNNRLTGTLSTYIGMLSNVVNLYMHYNQFTGTIPTEVGLLTSASDVFLSRNQSVSEARLLGIDELSFVSPFVSPCPRRLSYAQA
jgi:Leucine-rich repeat (LRR) protein